MTNAILRGKPDAGNPHVRFDEGEVASAKPRRGSLLYKQLMIAASAALMGFAASAKTVTVYVAPDGNDANDGSAAKPVLNLSKAVELMRLDKEADARHIIIRDGVYQVETNAVSLGQQDVNVTIEAEHPGKVLYTGAVPVKGWRPYPGDKRFLMADLPFKAQPRMFYMLSIGGANAEMASFPDFGGENKMPYLASPEDARLNNRTRLQYDSLFLPKGASFKDLDIESAWVTVPQEWATTRSYIATNDYQHDTFYLQSATGMPLGRFNTGFQIVNCQIGMRKPGMWMFESGKGRIVYWPKEGETAETLERNASISRATRFLSAFLTQNLTVRGITVEALAAPFSQPHGAPSAVAFGFSWRPHGKDLYNMTIEQCEVRNCAGEGISFYACNGCTARDCYVHHTGGTGIGIYSSCHSNALIGNHVHDCSLFNTAGSCINSYSRSVRMIGNHVHHSPGPGVVMWSSHSLFASNHLHHTMLSSRDGGSLYGAYTFTTLKDNWTHDTGNWPGLYNDEGGQRCVFSGNRFEGSWWPFHMHDCYGIVVTNNTIQCDDAMRLSFQGSVHCVFSNNLIRTTKMITEDPFMENCDVWMDNRIELKQADGSYKSAGKVTLPKVVKPAKPAMACVPMSGHGFNELGNWVSWHLNPQGSFKLDRSKEGYHALGVPGPVHGIVTGYDTTNVYFHGTYSYNALSGYPGSRHNGHEWGKDDAIRFCFPNGYTATVYFDKNVQAVFSDGQVATNSNHCMYHMRGVGDGWIYWAIAVPIEKTGFKPKTAEEMFGKECAFNAITYNGDHDEWRYYMQPNGDDLMTGRLKFVKHDPPDATQGVEPAILRATGAEAREIGAMVPGGLVQHDVETAYRSRNDYGEAEGWRARNQTLMGYVFRDRGNLASAGHRAFLMQGFTGETPTAETRRSQLMEIASLSNVPGRFGVQMQRWDFMSEACANEQAAYVWYQYPRGGEVKVLVDCNYADVGGKVASSEFVMDGAVATAHCRVKTGFFGKGYDVWAKIGFSQKPTKVEEVPYDGGKGKRMLLSFDMKPVSGSIVAKVAVSETSAEDAAARFAAAASGDDFAARKADAQKAWQKVLLCDKKTAGGVASRNRHIRAYKTALYGAYVMPGGAEKTFEVVCDSTEIVTVKVTGFKGPESRIKSATLNGKPLEDVIPEKCFKSGDVLALEF